ncbi:uncharacterized protein FOMMEDRAFT_159516 [Fomitiporia mediterranea MF3/22]|uniref:uncharacterized protein n=1 Tax=Fomitiporia mediterranea (strain MF3/22) TaxID=694068 RepID=UPI0004407F32|nr:uncharacterized protein FOMMEDRAFT_159516 [Fomitiporia mediterranea MF3/22]EJC99939.1 hypothetical protein FOMMEDRAFT_159516 [Fomitiporia mediterranea MF3/22]
MFFDDEHPLVVLMSFRILVWIYASLVFHLYTLQAACMSCMLRSRSTDSASTDEVVSATDSRVNYVGNGWTNQGNGEHMFTSVSGSFSLDFVGHAVSWYSRKLYNGATISITLDNANTMKMDLSSGMSENDTPVVAALFSKDGLDGSERHHLFIQWEGPGSNNVGSFLENYQIVFSPGAVVSASPSPNPAASRTPGSPTSPASSPSPSPISGSSSSQTSTTDRTGASSQTSTPGSVVTLSSNSSSVVTLTLNPNPNSISTPGSDGATGSGTIPNNSSSIAPPSGSSDSHPNIGSTVGGVVGGIVGALIFLCLVLLCLRRRKARILAQQESKAGNSIIFVHSPISFVNVLLSVFYQATPFMTYLERRHNPFASSALSQTSSMKLLFDSRDRERQEDRREPERIYVLVDPSYSATLLSQGALPQSTFTQSSTSNSQSLFSFPRGWRTFRRNSAFKARSDTTQGTSHTTTLGRPPDMSYNPIAFLPGNHEHQQVLDDPPPVYRS